MKTLVIRRVAPFLALALFGRIVAAEEPQPVAVSVTWEGDIRFEAAGGTATEPVRLVGGDFIVRRLLLSPDRAKVLILVDDITHVDWASRIFALDLKTRSIRVVYDSYRDRWSGPHYLLDAAVAEGRSKDRYPDNDVTDAFYDVKGVLHFTTEDGDTFATTFKDEVVDSLRIVTEVSPAPRTKVEKTHVGGEDAFRVRLDGK